MDSKKTNVDFFDDDISKLRDEITYLELKHEKRISSLKKRVLAIMIIVPFSSFGFVYYNSTTENQQPTHTGVMSEYVIEDVKGEKIDTWTAWNLVEGDTFHIHILASPEVTPERLQVIKDVIFSNETVTVGGLTYYKGWEGALTAVSHLDHKFVIPLHFHTIETSTGTGNILIKLSPLENADGNEAYTKAIADASNHEILKSEITIYNVDKINNEHLAALLRHELGHGFGLGHSDEQNDLMFSNINLTPPYEYISECDVEAMAGLYNGNEKSQVICTK